MKVIVALDSFKGCLTSYEAGNAVKEGILNANRNIDVIVKPLADGGEGSLDAMLCDKRIEKKLIVTKDPLGRDIETYYGIKNDTAIIEMAKTCGLELLKHEELNPMNTSTYGLGQMIEDAVTIGIKKFVIFIGGSATNDCGTGMLKALGYRFLDKDNKEVPESGGHLNKIKYIDESNVIKGLNKCIFNVACDVNNPLLGSNGASYIYAPQKGADDIMVRTLEHNLNCFADIVSKKYNIDHRNKKGAGAAGGLGFGLMSFLNAKLRRGIDIIFQSLNFDNELVNADYLITGEGKFDEQSLMGKAPISICKLAKEHNNNVKTIILAGSVDDKEIKSEFVDGYFSIINKPMDLSNLMKKEIAKNNLYITSLQLFRLLI